MVRALAVGAGVEQVYFIRETQKMNIHVIATDLFNDVCDFLVFAIRLISTDEVVSDFITAKQDNG